MKNILQEYVPFEHKNVEYVNGLIGFAREKKSSNNLEGTITASVIYANLVEYLMLSLIKNMQHMIYLLSYFNFQGVLFAKNEEESLNKRTLGGLKSELDKYEFPDKKDLCLLIEKFNKARNNLTHKLMAIDGEETEKLDKDFQIIENSAEEILQKYNVIINGLTSIWNKTLEQHK